MIITDLTLRRLIASKTTQQESSIANTKESDSDAHQKCIDAKDYQGCMKFATGQSQGKPDEDCPPDEWCTATKGIDPLGKQKIVGWQMRYEPSARRVTYKRSTPQKVNVRGTTDRYFELQMLVREEKNAVAAIAPKTTSYGSATTNCTGYGSSINCSTSSAPTITIPGRAGRAGGVHSWSGLVLYDCKERTWGLHLDGRLYGKWKKQHHQAATHMLWMNIAQLLIHLRPLHLTNTSTIDVFKQAVLIDGQNQQS